MADCPQDPTMGGWLDPADPDRPKNVPPVVWTHCPDGDCLLPAEVVDDYSADSTDGPVRIQLTLCARGHRYHHTLEKEIEGS